MAFYKVSIELTDAANRKARKVYETQDLVDVAAANTAAAGLVTDLEAVTGAKVLAYTVSERTVVTDSVTSGANVDEGLTISGYKADNYQTVVRVPAPETATWLADGTVDMSNADVQAYLGNFQSTGDFTVSDGEVIDSWIGGKLDK